MLPDSNWLNIIITYVINTAVVAWGWVIDSYLSNFSYQLMSRKFISSVQPESCCEVIQSTKIITNKMNLRRIVTVIYSFILSLNLQLLLIIPSSLIKPYDDCRWCYCYRHSTALKAMQPSSARPQRTTSRVFVQIQATVSQLNFNAETWIWRMPWQVPF